MYNFIFIFLEIDMYQKNMILFHNIGKSFGDFHFKNCLIVILLKI